MAVYLDSSRNRYGRMVMCHMIADTLEELHLMAERIGMKRAWFQQSPPASFPHYDVCQTRRAHAIKLGALALERRPFVLAMQRIRGR